MATFTVLVGPEKKKDKTFPLSIQIYHNKSKSYIPTGHFATRRQLGRDLQLKDEFVIQALNNTIVGYRERLLKITDINNRSAQTIKDFLLNSHVNAEIDFIKYARQIIAKHPKNKVMGAALTAFIDFLGTPTLPIHYVTLNLLKDFSAYLQTERTVLRGTKKKKLKPMIANSMADYMARLKQIFALAIDEYNTDDITLITNNPFRKFKFPQKEEVKKRNVKIDVVKAIRDAPDTSVRANLARDVFMLTFYLVGINPIDLYYLTDYENGRIFYNRVKTQGRRKDKAFISIKVEPEVLPLLEKYKDHSGKRVFNFYRLYKTIDSFNVTLSDGFKIFCEDHSIEKITDYYARHSWATIARNVCRISKDDIHFALNHSDPAMKITDLYIEEDFLIIDEANRKVLDTLL